MIKLNLDPEKINGGGKKLPEGRFRVRIEKVLVKPSKRFSTPGDKVVVEFDILQVFSKIPSVSWDGQNLDANVGDRRSYTIDMAKGDIAVGNVTAFTAACMGVDPQDPAAIKSAKDPSGKPMHEKDAQGDNGWTRAFCQLQSEQNPGRGIVLDVEVRKQTTGSNRTIMPHVWYIVQDEPKAA